MDDINKLRFETCLKCITRIGDCLEYSYLAMDKKALEKVLMKYLDECTEELSILNKGIN